METQESDRQEKVLGRSLRPQTKGHKPEADSRFRLIRLCSESSFAVQDEVAGAFADRSRNYNQEVKYEGVTAMCWTLDDTCEG